MIFTEIYKISKRDHRGEVPSTSSRQSTPKGCANQWSTTAIHTSVGRLSFPSNFCRVHIILHKPLGYTCSTVREHTYSQIPYDLLPVDVPYAFVLIPLQEQLRNLKPVLAFAGRLDKDVSGLVIMSQDGTADPVSLLNEDFQVNYCNA